MQVRGGVRRDKVSAATGGVLLEDGGGGRDRTPEGWGVLVETHQESSWGIKEGRRIRREEGRQEGMGVHKEGGVLSEGGREGVGAR